nr:CidA/LrgA family protein [Heyndrickxia coagulans]
MEYLYNKNCNNTANKKGVCNVKKAVIGALQIGLLWVIYEIGLEAVKILHLPVPGNVFGMLVLFLLLFTGILKLQWIDTGATWILKHLSFFFIPISVGLMSLGSFFLHNGVVLTVILAVSAVAGIVGTGMSAQLLARGREASHEQQLRRDTL